MGKSLQDLGLADEKIPTTDIGSLPTFGSFAPPPPMGGYRFRTAKDLTRCFDVFDTTEGQERVAVKRIKVEFEGDAPLTIIQSFNGEHVGEVYETTLTNVKRMRGAKGSGIFASDLDMLLKALGFTGSTPDSNAAYVRALQQYGGREFGADITYRWVCSDKRDIYVDDGQGGTTKVEGKKGCGRTYYPAERTKKADQQIDKVQGVYPYEIVCANPDCQNVVRAFHGLDNFRA